MQRFLLLVLPLLSTPALAIESARLELCNGVPRILIDNQPVRARMFWGAPGQRPIPVDQAGPITFEFVATEDEPARATLHFRFGHLPGDLYLDAVSVLDLDTMRTVFLDDFEDPQGALKRWNTWPVGDKNTVGTVAVKPNTDKNGSHSLHINLRKPADGKWPDFHLYTHANLKLEKGHRYRVSFWANALPARNLVVAFYRPGTQYVQLGGPGGVFESQIKLAADAGVHFVSFPCPMPWPKPGTPADWSGVDAACQRVLDANPAALLVPRVGVAAPAWWLDQHPDDVMTWDDGLQQPRLAIVSSDQFQSDAAARLAAVVAHIEEKFGPRTAGYHPCGQNTGEWFYEGTWKKPLNGYGKGEERAWRTWLTRKYKTEDALRAAWRQPEAALAAAALPTPAARRAAPNGVLRDPAAEQHLIDFADYQQQMMADCVTTLASAVREGSRGQKLVLFFYGYSFEFGPVGNGPATSGHYAMRQVLASRDIDILCSPISYFDRGPGGSAPAMSAAESVALAGKMWLMEDDTHTHLSSGDAPGWDVRVNSLELSRAQLLRNTAQCAIRNFGTWWMDLGATGWFDDPGLWQAMKQLEPLDRDLLKSPRRFEPEVALVIDERAMLRVAPGGQIVTRPLIYESRRTAGRMGAPYGQYLLDDVLAGRVHAKLYIFLNAWSLDAHQQKQLLEKTRGASRIFCYQPTEDLCGLNWKSLNNVPGKATPTKAGQAQGLTEPFGEDKVIRPLFTLPDATPEETWATYPDHSPAVVARTMADGKLTLFVGPPALSSQLLRAVARQAGVHLYTNTGANVYVNGPYMILHASQDGPVNLNAPRPLIDLTTNTPLPEGPLTLKKSQTRVLKMPQ